MYIYTDSNKDSLSYTYKDNTGAPYQMSRIDNFLVDQETGAYTTKEKIEEICNPFDNAQITLEVDFDKVIRGPGFWKLNNLHLENPSYLKLVKITIIELVNQYQPDTEHLKTEQELFEMPPEELQMVPTTLNPQEKMEQFHYTLKIKTINYSIRLQRERKEEQTGT